MRVTVKRDEFARLLAQASRVVETRNTIPILSHVMLNAKDGAISVAATDLDIELKDSCAAEVEESGATCVDAKMLADIAKRAAADVTLELGDQLLVKTGRSRFKLNVLPVDDFPSMEAGTFSAEFDVDLAALVGPVQFAMSNEETRFYLNGVYLHTLNGALTAVATDGHRLARNVGQSAENFEGVILPRKLVSLIPKGEIHLALSQNKVRVTAGDSTLTSKLVDGTFPDYVRVIPTSNGNIVTFDKDDMLRAADRVAVVSSEKGRAVRLSITADGVELSARGEGEASDSVEAALDGVPIDIGFNAAYLRDMLAVMPSGEVRMALGDSGSPAVVVAADGGEWTSVLMPMRVS